MRLILWVLVLFAAAVAVTLAVEEYSAGTIMVEIPPYEKKELPLDYAIVSVLAVFFVFYILIRMLGGLLSLRVIRSESLMMNGLQAFFEGNYAQARKYAAKGFKCSGESLVKSINAVVAARSAYELGDRATCEAVLQGAEGDTSNEKALRLITKIDLLVKDGRYQEALGSFEKLYKTGGLQSTLVLQLEMEAQKHVKNWDAVLEISGILIQRHPLNKDYFEKVRYEAHMENFKRKASDRDSLNKYWLGLTEYEQSNSQLAAAAVRIYIALGECAMAHKIIEQNVQNGWNAELIALYAECLNYHVNRQIECAEVWLKAQPNNAGLLLTLGKLCTHCELWGKAQNYLEASISVGPSTTAYFALAQLNEKLGKHEIAMDNYNKAVEFTLKKMASGS
ncbi:MAG: heme biosynthesis protein HemY [Nitrosomonas sp.]|nr:heme biosynthesis protein HemY [Nitrosomonas sp.]